MISAENLAMSLSRHFVMRAQQRGIPLSVSALLEQYGTRMHDGRGGLIRYFDKRSRKRVEREVGFDRLRSFRNWIDAYQVESACDGIRITIGHRHKRLKRR